MNSVERFKGAPPPEPKRMNCLHEMRPRNYGFESRTSIFTSVSVPMKRFSAEYGFDFFPHLLMIARGLTPRHRSIGQLVCSPVADWESSGLHRSSMTQGPTCQGVFLVFCELLKLTNIWGRLGKVHSSGNSCDRLKSRM
jgi:hypothetical protein